MAPVLPEASGNGRRDLQQLRRVAGRAAWPAFREHRTAGIDGLHFAAFPVDPAGDDLRVGAGKLTPLLLASVSQAPRLSLLSFSVEGTESHCPGAFGSVPLEARWTPARLAEFARFEGRSARLRPALGVDLQA